MDICGLDYRKPPIQAQKSFPFFQFSEKFPSSGSQPRNPRKLRVSGEISGVSHIVLPPGKILFFDNIRVGTRNSEFRWNPSTKSDKTCHIMTFQIASN